MIYKKTISEIGNSLGIIIPADVLKYLGVEKGSTINMQVEEGKKGKYISLWKETSEELVKRTIKETNQK